MAKWLNSIWLIACILPDYAPRTIFLRITIATCDYIKSRQNNLVQIVNSNLEETLQKDEETPASP